MSTSDASNLRQRRGHASAADSSKSGNAAANGKLEDKPILELLESPAMPWYLRPDALIAWAFLLVGAISRFYDIGEPRLIVFDETHFTKFLTWYWSGHYFVDIHPPLAKGVFALVLKYLTDFKGAREDHVKWWTNDGFVGTNDWKLLYEQSYGEPYIILRQTSALIGTIMIPVAFLTGRAAGLSRLTAGLIAWMVLLEGVIALQSRLILCDVFLYFFNIASIGASFASIKYGGFGKSSISCQVGWAMVVGLMLGCAVSVKLTALGTIAVVGLHQACVLLSNVYEASKSKATSSQVVPIVINAVWRAAVMLSTAAFIFFGLWIWHLEALPWSGQGDNFHIREFQMMLHPPPLNNPPGLPRGPSGSACPVIDSYKRDCWDGVWPLSPDTCVAHGCCWATHPTPGIPWCFHSSEVGAPGTEVDPWCPNHDNAWSDCGHGGINKEQCEAKGCCYDSTSPQAWCYHKGELARPQMALVPKIQEVLRATWANNQGEAVMDHPFMSEWYEWPTMNCKSVPFSGTSSPNGNLKAMGNPAVWYAVIIAVVIACFEMTYRGAWGAVAALTGEPSAAKPAAAADTNGDAAADPATAITTTTTPESTEQASLHLPLFIFTSGYLLNLVPYVLIPRSKFVYHYVPALMVGMLLVATALEYLLRSPVKATRERAYGLVLGMYAIVFVSFCYFNLPSAYGMELTHDQVEARKWNPKW